MDCALLQRISFMQRIKALHSRFFADQTLPSLEILPFNEYIQSLK